MQLSHDPAEYGDRIAHLYDELYPDTGSADMAAETLAGLAGGGPVLELGIGTGRIALPLSADGGGRVSPRSCPREDAPLARNGNQERSPGP